MHLLPALWSESDRSTSGTTWVSDFWHGLYAWYVLGLLVMVKTERYAKVSHGLIGLRQVEVLQKSFRRPLGILHHARRCKKHKNPTASNMASCRKNISLDLLKIYNNEDLQVMVQGPQGIIAYLLTHERWLKECTNQRHRVVMAAGDAGDGDHKSYTIRTQ